VGRVPVFAGPAGAAIEECLSRIATDRGGRVATANLDFLAIARGDREALALLESCDLVVADGAPVAWLARFVARTRVERLAGVDLTLEILRAAAPGLRVAMYGGEESISAAAAAELQRRHPGTQIVLRHCPPYRALSAPEIEEDLRAIREARPDLVLVALGFPRQERLIAEYQRSAPNALWIGIGGTFDFIAGKRVRAPGPLQALGMEWLVRLAQEPGRLWKRYLLRDLPEAGLAACEALAARLRGSQRQPLN
jgi:N-acetylglucosaminyldiphosphoundecaprenol N-acetyl-beta-D-mannosaminyltransferase